MSVIEAREEVIINALLLQPAPQATMETRL